MSRDTNLNWFYEIVGRNVHLWQYNETSTGDDIIYPDEDITNGLRFEGTAYIKPFVAEAIEDSDKVASGTDISFALSGTRITTDDNNNFWDTTSGFAVGDKIRVVGSASNDADYTIDSFSGSGNSNMVVSGSTLTDENTGEKVNIYQIPKEVTSPDETSHVNLSRTLSLAVIDYVKAQKADMIGEVDQKEYYMREFYRKIGDSQSNKYRVAVALAQKPFAIV